MATTTNYGWTTPDNSALVKDGASAIRTLGSSIDTTTKNLNPSTTLGDIEYRSSTANTNTRLGIGTTGQVLSVSGGVPAWITPGGTGTNWTLLNAGGTSLTGTSTSITGISGQDKLMIIIKGASHGSAVDDNLGIQFNTDTANNYSFQGHYTLGYTTYSKSQFGPFNQTANNVNLFTSSTSAAESGSGYVLLSGANSSGVKVFNAAGGASAGTGNGQGMNTIGGIYNSTSTISSVQIKWTTYSSTFDAGTVFIYGSA